MKGYFSGMDKILIKTLGDIIDSLITTNLKIFYYIEVETNESKSEHERFEAGQTVIKLNKKRNELISGINQLMGEEDLNIKTY